jgi:drug/metabolite transporter (DMT)-like permease
VPGLDIKRRSIFNHAWFSDNPAAAGALMVTTGALLISFSAVFVKLAHVSPTISGVYRTLIGGVVLLAIIFLRKETFWKGGITFLMAVILGFIFALDIYFWHTSIHFVGPGLATILANFQVFLLALYGVFVLGERLSVQTTLTIPMAFLGLYLLAGIHWGQEGQNYKLGVFSGLAAAACYAAYLLILRKLQSLENTPSPMANLAVISLVSGVLLGIWAWNRNESFLIPDIQSFISLGAYGVLSQVCGWLLITTGLPYVRSTLAGLIILLQPSLSFIWDILLFNRQTDFYGAIGAFIALAAIYLGTTVKEPQKRNFEPTTD